MLSVRVWMNDPCKLLDDNFLGVTFFLLEGLFSGVCIFSHCDSFELKYDIAEFVCESKFDTDAEVFKREDSSNVCDKVTVLNSWLLALSNFGCLARFSELPWWSFLFFNFFLKTKRWKYLAMKRLVIKRVQFVINIP